MKCYIITFEINSNIDIQIFYENIKSHGKWSRITEYTWAVVTTSSAKEIRDGLMSIMKKEDRLFVIKSGLESAWFNSICKNEWLRNNL